MRGIGCRRILVAIALLTSAATAFAQTPHLATVVGADAAGQGLRVRGPDGGEWTVQLREKGVVLAESGKDVGFADLAAGRTVALLLADPTTAAAITLLSPKPMKAERGWLRALEPKGEVARFEAEDGYPLSLRFARNSAGFPAGGEVATTVSANWLREQIDQPFTVERVKVHGQEWVWAMRSWDTRRKRPSDSETAPPAAAGEAAATTPVPGSRDEPR